MQKKVGNALYVFDTTPFTITEDTDAEVIYVQQEYLKGYLELNTELESKIKTFNQWLLCVNAPWADEVTPGPGPGPEPTPDYHLLTLSDANNIYISGYNSEQLPGDYSNDWFSVINNAQKDAGMINADEGNKIYCNAGAKVFLFREPSDFETMTGLELIQTEGGERYGFVMGDSDMTVNYSYTEKLKYNINFTEDSNAQGDINVAPSNQMIAGNNVVLQFLNGQGSSTIAVTSNDVELTYDQNNDEYYFTMPEHNVNIKAVYTQPIQISIDLGGTDLTCASYEPSGTYYPHAFFVVQAPEGKTTDNYTFVKSDNEHIVVNPVGDHFDVEFKASGTVTFANA